MGEELNFDKKIYVLPKIKWYKKLWYIITRQKDKDRYKITGNVYITY